MVFLVSFCFAAILASAIYVFLLGAYAIAVIARTAFTAAIRGIHGHR